MREVYRPVTGISDEVIGPSPCDLYGQIQARLVDGFIARERGELAAVCGDYTAWMMYPPTSHDDPTEWAPYWTRLTNLRSEGDE